MNSDEAMEELARAFGELVAAVWKAAEQLTRLAREARKEFDTGWLLEIRPRAPSVPRRTVSRARSPAIRRWWIHYKPRDCLPCIILKLGGRSSCQRKRSAFLIRSLP